MLGSLILNVNTDNVSHLFDRISGMTNQTLIGDPMQLKGAFDVNIDLSNIGQIEITDNPFIHIEMLFDSQPLDFQSSSCYYHPIPHFILLIT